MCDFFSFVTEGDGILKYFNWPQRWKIINGELFLSNGQSVGNADSHSEICAFYNIDCDKANKYEHNFLTKEFKIDQINTKNDSETCKLKVKRLKVKKIIEPLNIKRLIDPTKIKIKKIEIDEAIDLIRQWDSVGASVWAYISSFFTIQYKYDFSSCVKLWESGYVPSFDGKTWRLHGYKGKILWEGVI